MQFWIIPDPDPGFTGMTIKVIFQGNFIFREY